MTDRKTPRNTTELPVTVAIARLRELLGDLKAEHDEVDARGQGRARKILFRVPEVVREHVAREGGFPTAMAELEASSNETSQPGAIIDPGEPDDFPDELPAGARPMSGEQRERVARLTGAGRSK